MEHRAVYAVSDLHLGLDERGAKGHMDMPVELASFLRWLATVPPEGHDLRVLGEHDLETRKLKPPSELLLLGDAVELWDADNDRILLSALSVAPALSAVPCPVTHVLGNHDIGFHTLQGTYPRAGGTYHVVGEVHPSTERKKPLTTSIGGKPFLFLHGHQFDLAFRDVGATWRLIAPVRQFGAALGDYAYVFAFWWLATLLDLWFHPQDATMWLLAGLLPWVFLPRLWMRGVLAFMRHHVGSTHDRDKTLRAFGVWWKKHHEDPGLPEDVTIVYGHTHFLDCLRPGGAPWSTRARTEAERKLDDLVRRAGAKRPTMLNLSSWVTRNDEPARRTAATFFYADEQGPLLLGWDWVAKRPFHLPLPFIEVVRGDEPLNRAQLDQARQLGWPEALLAKWASGKESLTKEDDAPTDKPGQPRRTPSQ